MKISDDVKLDYSDVLLRPKRSRLLSRSEVTLTRKFKFPHSNLTWEGVPIMSANMDTVGTFPVAQIFGKYDMLTCIHKHYSIDEWLDFLTTSSYRIIDNTIMSAGLEDWDILQKLNGSGAPKSMPKFICLDVANGYSQAFADAVSRAREEFEKHIIIAGNVATPEMTEELILRGADVVKVGIGPGRACSTRMVTGVGYPQLSAVMECADAAHGIDGHIIADGGCKTPGDIAKAFSAGADFVMVGSMLAGHDETGLEFYGMSSHKAQRKYGGHVKDYRASEGLELEVEYRGKLEDTVKQILGGVRSAATYIGAREIRHMPKCASFIRCSRIK